MHIEIDEGVHSLLIVEDEGLLAMMMEELARELGIGEVHLHADVASALAAARTLDIDCAVLDLRLRDGSSMPLADLLALREVPFFFATGSDLATVSGAHRDRPSIGKPFSDDDFKRIILDTAARGRAARMGDAEELFGRVASVHASD